jgi:hypothetical protein
MAFWLRRIFNLGSVFTTYSAAAEKSKDEMFAGSL